MSASRTLTGSFFSQVQKNWCPSRSIYFQTILRPPPLSSFMELLIDRGADPDAPDADGRTPLMLLCGQPPNIPTALLINALLLLRRRAVDVRVIDKQKRTALHHIVGGSPGAVFHSEPCSRLQVLLNYSGGALGVDARDCSDRTPLHLVLEARDPGDASRMAP
ncbi:Uu.00g058320.m01.CDS01 [Anthostomella pinea]|uniref:Uu.00g058320.m01.CDS01 n=1 Tax=Anthostomella pinea TaxID=933095 RepID=A0AAI8YM80_9PEZI|nr:Uu.00g058320.m01.CDS01 [Anthostomella pinea]